MSDDVKNRGCQDAARIDVDNVHDARYWACKFGCTREQLEAAVKSVGVLARDVEAHLKE